MDFYGIFWTFMDFYGLFMDFYPRPPEFSKIWMLDKRFEPEISATQREKKYAGWLACVDQVLKVKS